MFLITSSSTAQCTSATSPSRPLAYLPDDVGLSETAKSQLDHCHLEAVIDLQATVASTRLLLNLLAFLRDKVPFLHGFQQQFESIGWRLGNNSIEQSVVVPWHERVIE